MLGTSVRRGLAALGTTIIAATATLAVTAAPAHAAPTGNLLTKGAAGTVYSNNSIVSQGVVPGGTPATFFHKIINTSPTAEQFKVTVTPAPGAVATLYEGSVVRKSPYYTPPIAPGGSLILSLKVALPGGSAVGEYYSFVSLRDPETNAHLDAVNAHANATYQSGTTRNDLFLRTGTQPYVGGSGGPSAYAYESANALKVGNTATYLLRLKNNGSTTSTMTLDGNPFGYCGGALTITVKQGTRNVTAAVMGGTYSTGSLAPGGRKDLKVFVKLVQTDPCTTDYVQFKASGPDGDSARVHAQVLIGV